MKPLDCFDFEQRFDELLAQSRIRPKAFVGAGKTLSELLDIDDGGRDVKHKGNEFVCKGVRKIVNTWKWLQAPKHACLPLL